jgi:hypothetical protein
MCGRIIASLSSVKQSQKSSDVRSEVRVYRYGDEGGKPVVVVVTCTEEGLSILTGMPVAQAGDQSEG